MKKLLTGGMAAFLVAGSGLATATSAAAQEWHHGWRGGYDYRHDDDAGAAIAGGLVGLALGAALASGTNHYYGYGPYYGPGYYGPGYAVCTQRRAVWDPYLGRYIVRYYRYAC
ncbi:MAG TPA: hypothetical protein VGS12_03605 [Caulobacteraceae bacterium]|nr:hypothetical protein [Caulobacteraceae bacterium]